ncbi:glucokinase [Hahella sp. CCB-MM4]|uniref:glucokinase n=1 Tax=Hahella sp. (strain CCB-MM4) TaxID=1926491 RepID=UPI000B9AB976|nr:glucokinase [Hahella sp. CCB-MM4]OZG75304.1 glucokinase [Hahella sp. CCB-MM4]
MSKQEFALVGDIGGTNARFALVEPGSTNLQHIEVLPCADYDNLDGAVLDYLERCQVTDVSEASIAFACPVHNDIVKMTNNHWVFSKKEVQSKLGLTSFKCINDFTAMALGVPHIAADQLIQVGGLEAEDDRVMSARARLVIGPGTGLGVSGLVKTRANWVPLSTEGGHVSFAPTTDLEISVLKVLMERFDRVSVERILCGDGLVNLYQSLAQVTSRESKYHKPSEITDAALKGEDELAEQTLAMFCKIFGQVAGDAALTIGALGGVYVCGGIIPRFTDFFKSSGFREAFENKGRMRGYLESIPVFVVMEAYTGLLGAAEALANSEV